MAKARLNIVDFHAHILPGADHGSSAVETSMLQLKHAITKGFDRIVATPHFYPMADSVESFLSRRNSSYELLSKHLDSDMPEIRLGAEVLVCNGIERLPGLEKLFLYGTSTLLLELPFTDFQQEYADSVYRLTSEGVDVILAHAERYDPHHIDIMIENGARLQCNAYVFSKMFCAPHLVRWIENHNIVALGSDIHQNDASAYSGFVKAISRLGEYADYIKAQSDAIWNASLF